MGDAVIWIQKGVGSDNIACASHWGLLTTMAISLPQLAGRCNSIRPYML